jgi:putative hemolysin
MQIQELDRAVAQRPRLGVELARSDAAIREAQALRYRIFTDELGARIAGKVEGIDRDIFDPHCEHLLVRDNGTGEVVGTYRMLPPHQARRIGGFYADEEFDLTRLYSLRDHTVELGRSCVHPDYRHGATIALLWSAIADYVRRHQYAYLMGCASVSLADGGLSAAQVYRLVRAKHWGPIEWRVTPRCPIPDEMLNLQAEIKPSERDLPALIKGYLRAGAVVCGDPAWDPDFNTADLFMLLPIAALNDRHASRFMGRQSM